MKSKSLLVLAASGLLVLSACGKQPQPEPQPVDPTPVDPQPVDPQPAAAEPANGVFDYTNVSNAEKTQILGTLEKYAVDNKLTGLPVVENGGYVMYNPTIRKGAPRYIKGYGFGILTEGELTGDLEGETDARYKRYYHTFESDDPSTILYMDDKGSVVGDLVGYVSGGYYDIVMNEERTGYIWVGDLATNDEPIAVDPAADGSSKVYRVPVKTGEALKYSTLTDATANPALAAFNNRPVVKEDYLTPYKILYTAFYGMKRNGELKDKNDGSLKGTDAYVAATKTAYSDEAFAELGIKALHNDELGDYLEFTLNKAYTPFWARYYITSSMMAPVPEAFLEALGGTGGIAAGAKLWGHFNTDASLTPADTFLSTGPYTLEKWDYDNLILFKRNPNYVSGSNRANTRPSSYNIQGVHIDINKATKTNVEAAFDKYLNREYHAVAIPNTKIEQYYNHPETTIVPGQTTTKLNLNTCDEATWEQLFGENGSIVQTAKANYWEVKPAMSNKHFIDGLSYAIDRKTMAAKIGRTPSCDYFGSAFYADPENGIFYNDTDIHKEAMAASLEGTDEYGYSLEKAKAAFKLAAEELIAAGKYKVGDTIEIEMTWQSDNNVTVYGNTIAKYCEDAFNAADTGLTLKFKHFVVDYWEKAYDEKMQIGQFDIGFGSISGDYYNPLACMEWLKSDNSSTFTLNWGVDTNEKAELEYDGKLWSFDALWEVANNGGNVKAGRNSPVFKVNIRGDGVRYLEDGSIEIKGREITADIKDEAGNSLAYSENIGMCFYGYCDADSYTDYMEIYFYPDGTTDLSVAPYNDECTWVYADELDEEGYRAFTITLSPLFAYAWSTFFDQDDPDLHQGIDCYKAQGMFGAEPVEGFAATVWKGVIAPYVPAV